MYVLVVTMQIKPEFRDRYIDEMILDARGSRENEPGCLRFDIVQDENDPNRIYLYEVYRDKAAFDDHLQAPHFVTWRAAVAGWLETPSVAGRGSFIDPPDAEYR